MPRTWYIPRWRHLLMQLVMWLVLGTSVVLAAVLDRHLRREQIVDFGAPVVDESLSFSFPASWKAGTQRNEAGVTEHFASDSTSGGVRKITISRQPLSHPMGPAQYILLAKPIFGQLNARDFKGVIIDGWPGQSIYWQAHRFSLGAEDEFQFTNCSAIVLPDNEAVMVRMDKDAPFDPGDQRLYHQVLDQVRINIQPPTDGGTLHLSRNITIAVPADLRVYPQVDELSNTATVSQISDTGGWISAEFVPVAVPGNQPSASLAAGLAARDSLDPQHANLSEAWITAEVSASGPNLWTITPEDSSNDAFIPLRVAHLLTSGDGWGLMVLLSCEPPATADDLNHLWDELFAGIHLGEKSTPLADLLDSGAAIARTFQLRQPNDAFGMWTHGSTPIGFSRGFGDPEAKYGSRYTVKRQWNGSATAVLEQWGVNVDLSVWSHMARSDAGLDFNSPLGPVFEETTTLGDTITTIVHEPGGRETQQDFPLSPAFVLSRSMPKIINLVNTAPCAFWTDRFPGVEGEHFPTPMLLLAHRLPDQNGLRCVEAEVNGTGRVSRWYCRPNQKFDHADFAGDLHLRPASQGDVESAFAGDRRLTIQPH